MIFAILFWLYLVLVLTSFILPIGFQNVFVLFAGRSFVREPGKQHQDEEENGDVDDWYYY